MVAVENQFARLAPASIKGAFAAEAAENMSCVYN